MKLKHDAAISASALLAAPAIGKGGDATAYDPALSKAFASNGEGAMTVVDGNAPSAILHTLPTMQRARLAAPDTALHEIFLLKRRQTAYHQPGPGQYLKWKHSPLLPLRPS
jgi:hypothetical protein